MKMRKKFTNNVSQIYSHHKSTMQDTKLAILLVISFIIGFLISWNFLVKPLNNSQLEFCEQVARDVYEQKWQTLVEDQEDVTVTTTSETITVKLSDSTYRGNVVAKLQNGELVITRNLETGTAILLSVVAGVLFIFIFCILLFYIDKIDAEIKK